MALFSEISEDGWNRVDGDFGISGLTSFPCSLAVAETLKVGVCELRCLPAHADMTSVLRQFQKLMFKQFHKKSMSVPFFCDVAGTET